MFPFGTSPSVCYAFLSQNADRLLGREAITQAVWPGVTVSDDSITQCVRDLRRVLRDEARPG